MKSNISHSMIVSARPRGNLSSVFFIEFSQICSNFVKSEDSRDYQTSMNVDSLMADSNNMDEKFVMLEKTIVALKKSVDEKNLHSAQLMKKLEAFTLGESTCASRFDQSYKDVKESLAKSKF